MKEFIKNEKKLLYICAVVTVCIALLIILLRVSSGFGNVCKAVYTFFNELTSLIKPLLFGYVIAYLLHRPCLFLQKKLTEKKILDQKAKSCPYNRFGVHIFDGSGLCGGIVRACHTECNRKYSGSG